MKVIEFGVTLQGELPYIGKPCVLIRLQGCNLDCEWCDADLKAEPTEYSILELIEKVQKTGIKQILLTGGEPLLLDPSALKAFYEACGRYALDVVVETNGTIPIRHRPQNVWHVMDCKLFLDRRSSEWYRTIDNMKILRPQDAIKFVYASKTELEQAFKVVDDHLQGSWAQLIFSPVIEKVGDMYINEIIHLASKYPHLDIRFQRQLHKILDIA